MGELDGGGMEFRGGGAYLGFMVYALESAEDLCAHCTVLAGRLRTMSDSSGSERSFKFAIYGLLTDVLRAQRHRPTRTRTGETLSRGCPNDVPSCLPHVNAPIVHPPVRTNRSPLGRLDQPPVGE